MKLILLALTLFVGCDSSAELASDAGDGGPVMPRRGAEDAGKSDGVAADLKTVETPCPFVCDITSGGGTATCCLCPYPSGALGCCSGLAPAGTFGGTCCGKPCSP